MADGDRRTKMGNTAVPDTGISGEQSLEHSACCSIIMRIADLGPAQRRPDQVPRFFDVVRQTHPAAQRRSLEGILRIDSAYDTFESRAFVYAKRVPRGRPVLWPVLAFAADRASQRLKVRVALFFEDGSETGRAAPLAVGWRFEPPEDETGEHSYYHAQPISSWDVARSGPLPICGNLNDIYPTIPLAAKDSLSLLCAVLASLYGRLGVRDILSDSQVRRSVRPVQQKLESWR